MDPVFASKACVWFLDRSRRWPLISPYMSTRSPSAAEYKAKADAAYKSGHFAQSCRLYNDALALDPSNATLLSNISAANFELGDYEEAYEMAKATIMTFIDAPLHNPGGVAPPNGLRGKNIIRLARSLVLLKRNDEALAIFLRMLGACTPLEMTPPVLAKIKPLTQALGSFNLREPLPSIAQARKAVLELPLCRPMMSSQLQWYPVRSSSLIRQVTILSNIPLLILNPRRSAMTTRLPCSGIQ